MAEDIEPAIELQPVNHIEPTMQRQTTNPAAEANNPQHGVAVQGRDANMQLPRWTRLIDGGIMCVIIPASIVGAVFVAIEDGKTVSGFTAFGVLLALQVFLRTVIRDNAGMR